MPDAAEPPFPGARPALVSCCCEARPAIPAMDKPHVRTAAVTNRVYLVILISASTVSLCALNPLAAEHGGAREEPLAARNLVLVVVEELELSFSQLVQRHVGGRTRVQRAPVVEHWKCT